MLRVAQLQTDQRKNHIGMLNNSDKRHLKNGAAVPPRGQGCKAGIYGQRSPEDFPAAAGGFWSTVSGPAAPAFRTLRILMLSLRSRQRKEKLVFFCGTVGTGFAGGKAALGFLQAAEKWDFDWFLNSHNWHILNNYKRLATLLKSRAAL